MRGIGISLQSYGVLRLGHFMNGLNSTNMKAGLRVGVGFGFISMLLAAATWLGLAHMAQIKGSLDGMNVNHAEGKLVSEMYLTVTERALAMRNLILLTDENEIRMEIDRINVQTGKYAAAEKQFRALIDDNPGTTVEEKEKLEQIRDVSLEALPYIETATALALAKQGKEAYHLLRFEFRPIQKRWWQLMRELAELEAERNRKAIAEAEQAYEHARMLMLGFGAIAVFLGALAAWLIARADRRLQSSEQSFRALAENSPDIIVRFDRECRRVLLNPAYYRETGIPPGTAHGKSPGELWHTTANLSAAEYEATLRRVMEIGASDDLLLEWKTTGGKLISHALRIVPERDLAGKVTGALAIGRNITELKEAERQLRQSHAQLHELTLHREAVQEEERKDIARELHDELGQILTALHMQISVLRLKFGKDHPALAEHAHSLSKMVDTTMQVVRRVVSSLRPPALDMGITSALEWLAEEFQRHSGVECRISVEEGEAVFDEKRAVALFRIVQESLTNVARHAHASLVEIALQRRDRCYCLEVRDNGQGFDPDLPRPKSFGLAGMRERVHALGGTLAIASRAGQGTVLRVHFPVDAIARQQ